MRGWATGLRGLLGGGMLHAHDVYYVDATGGNDGNTGRSSTDAWQTIGKVNGETFQQGDTILFKRGETWALAASLGVPQHGLTFGAYGSGADPILDGQDTVDCIDSNGKNSLTFRNIDCTQGLDFGFVIGAVHGVALIDCSAHDCGNDNVIFDGSYNCLVSGGTFYDAYTRTNDDRLISGIEVKDAAHDIVIDGAEIYGIDASAYAAHYGAGVAIHNHAGQAMAYNITVQNCNIHDQGTRCYGIRVNNTNTAGMTDRNIVIAENTIIDGAYGGIQVNSTAGTSYRLTGVTVRDNVVRLNAVQWQIAVVNCNNVRVYRNLTTNNNNAQLGQNIQIFQCTNTYVYNNTTYSLYNNFWYSVFIEGATTENVEFTSNIVGTLIANIMNVAVALGTGTTGLVIDYNLYQYTGVGNRWYWLGVGMNYTNWLTNNSNDANSPARADPLFTDPANNDFTLQAGSPARGAGEGGVDCGAYPYTG